MVTPKENQQVTKYQVLWSPHPQATPQPGAQATATPMEAPLPLGSTEQQDGFMIALGRSRASVVEPSTQDTLRGPKSAWVQGQGLTTP